MEYLAPFFDNGRVGWTLLGIAAMVLMVSVVVLARLRWSQARPIATCVVLSMVAHVLLVCSAYLTRLFDTPRPPGEAGIRIRLVDTSPQSKPTHAARAEWDRLAIEPVPVPQMTPLPLAATESDEPQPKPELTAESPVEEEAAAAVLPPPIADLVESKSALPPSPLEPQEIAEDPPSRPSSLAEVPDQPQAPESTAVVDESMEATSPSQDDVSTIDTPRTNEQTQPPTAGEAHPVASPPPSHRLPPKYRSRLAQDRDEIVRRRGGDAETEAAVHRALEWLAASQSHNGQWDASAYGAGQGRLVEGQFRGSAGLQADTGISGLALLAFLGAGHTHQHGDYQGQVAHGLEFIIRNQTADGSLAGPATNYARMYCHGIATLALCEALAMTGDDRLRPFVERAVTYSLDSQHPATGGWRYHPGDVGDTSQFGWQLMALMSADQADIAVPPSAIQGMHRYLMNASQGVHRGLAAYRPGQAVSRCMTAEALVCREFLGVASPQTTQEATAYIREELPGQGRVNLYYWYYATLALSQKDSPAWREWNESLKTQLMTRQRGDGAAAGSWDPDTVWGSNGGRVYSTALAALCLEVYYRYEP